MVRKKTRVSKRLNKSRKRKTKKIKQNEFKKMISEMEQSVQKDHEKCNTSCYKIKTNYAKDKKKHQLKQKCHHDCWKKRMKTVKAFHKKYPKEFKVFVKNQGGGGTKKRRTENKRKKRTIRKKNKEDIPKKEDCDKVEKFFKEPVKKGKRMKWSPPIWGIPEDENRVRKHKEYNVFEEKSEKIPKGYQKAEKFPYDKEYMEGYICGEKIPAVKKEVPEFKKGFKHTLIHDNGGRPFVMYFSPKKDSATVYKIPQEFSAIDFKEMKKKDYFKYYSELVKRFKCKDVFIGVSPKNEMTKFSKGYGKKFEGNTNLIKLSDKRYVYVGETIFEFTSLKKIVDYQSPVGNSDVPYPYAIDEKDNYYLMLDKVIVTSPMTEEGPYDKYWNGGLMTTDLGFVPPKEPIYPNFQDIKEFFIVEKSGKKQKYTLRHAPNPGKDYDRLVKDIGKPLSVKYTDGKEKDLSKQDYIQLMNDFGKLLNTKSFKIKLVHKRVGW